MSNPIRFQDHTAFHIQVLRVSLGGAALSLLYYLIAFVTPLNPRPAQIITLAFSAAVLGLIALPPRRVGLVVALGLAAALGLLGALGQGALAQAGYPWFGYGLYGVALGVIAGRDLSDWRRYVLPIATGCSVALATYVTLIFQQELRFEDYVPPFLAKPAYGAVFGFLVSIGLIVRQIVIDRDAVVEAYDKVKPTLDGEMKELSERAMGLYGRIRQVLRDRKDKGAENEGLNKVVSHLVLDVIHLGPKWNEVERGVGHTSAEDLGRRVEELEKKIADSTDDVARKQYSMAKDALNSQLSYLKDIARSRERVIARVHNYLATLERLHLCVVNHRGTDAAKFSDEVQPILDEINSLGHEMDFASEAMREVAEVEAQAEAKPEEKPAEQPAPAAAIADVPTVPAVDPAVAEAAKQPPEQPAEPKPAEPADAEASLASRAFDK
jgi:hypothetical protein